MYIDIKETNGVENKGDVLACKYYHTLFPNGIKAISNDGVEDIDNKDWEIFHINYETDDCYYGIPMEGLGLCNCMIYKSDTRPFTKQELEKLQNITLGMFGSLTGNDSGMSWKVNIEPIVNLL